MKKERERKHRLAMLDELYVYLRLYGNRYNNTDMKIYYLKKSETHLLLDMINRERDHLITRTWWERVKDKVSSIA